MNYDINSGINAITQAEEALIKKINTYFNNLRV